MDVTPDERRWLDAYRKVLAERFPGVVVDLVIYGSKARGDADAESDTDVLVVVSDDAVLDNVKTITREDEFETANGSWVNWRILSDDIYAEYRRLKFPFYVNVRRDGVELWDEAASLIEEIEYPLDFQEGVPRPMTPETIETIRLHVREANERWEAVDKLRVEMPLFAIPPAYYAAFYMATAALYAVNVVRSKHEGVRNGLSEFLVKPKLLEEEYKDIYERLLNGREWVDYRPFHKDEKTLTDGDARQLLRDAERFIARLERFLRERGAIE
jgi:uncharacterized protein (UPF0332 family)/predicted nucleotidyltransferase